MPSAIKYMKKRKLRKNIKLNCEHRQQQVAEMYRNFKSQHEIAEILGVSQPTVCNDIAAIKEVWLKSSQMNMTERLAEEISRLDRLERLAMEAYDRSCEDAVQITTEKIPVRPKKPKGDEDGPARPTKRVTITKVSEQRKGQCGNPAFLAEARACVEKRCKLLGLLDERAVNINNNSVAADFSTLFARKDDPQLSEKRTPTLTAVDDPLERELKQLESQAGIQREVT